MPSKYSDEEDYGSVRPFLFVVAEAPRTDLTMIGFRFKFVRARCVDEVYVKHWKPNDRFCEPDPGMQFLNCLAVDLEPARDLWYPGTSGRLTSSNLSERVAQSARVGRALRASK